MKGKKGIALILAVGILAVLAVIATSFALNMRLEYKASMNYSNGVKARYIAEAGLQKAIAELKSHVKSSAFDYFDGTAEPWATEGYSAEGDITDIAGEILGSWDCSTVIADEQRKININNTYHTNLESILENLILILKTYGSENDHVAGGTKPSGRYNKLDSGNASVIIGNRPTTGYLDLQDIIARTEVLGDNKIDERKLRLLKPFITIHSYEDPNSSYRLTINVNTADQAVIATVLWTDSGLDPDEAWDVADRILNDRELKSWQDFNDAIDRVRDDIPGNEYKLINSAQATTIKDNCNPNRNTDATKFCFHSGGYYSITATGAIYDATPTQIAEKTLTAIVKIYDIYTETTKEDFAGGTPERVTWLDHCPVNSNALFGTAGTQLPLASHDIVEGSIKLGYWDDFDEDRTGYTQDQWLNEAFVSGYGRTTGSEYALLTTENASCNLWRTTDSTDWWDWDNFSLSVFVKEYDVPSNPQMKDVAWILVRNNGSASIPTADQPAILHTRQGELESWDYPTGYGSYAYLVEDLGRTPTTTGEVDFLTIAGYVAETGYGDAVEKRYDYGNGQIRIFYSYTDNDAENYDNTTQQTSFTHNAQKIFNISVNSQDVSATVWNPASGWLNSANFSRNAITEMDASGRIVLYANNVKAAWDDIRIISPDGSYTSATFTPTSPATDVEWGTITGTITIPSTATAASETVSFQTKSSGDPDWIVLTGNDITSVNGTSIEYKALLATADTDIQQTPVLEDVTITYLRKTEIKSYSISSE